MTPETPSSTGTSSSHPSTSEANLKSRFEDFQTRAKIEWSTAEAKARAELAALPTKIKTSAAHAFERLRNNLDLPRRAEVAALTARIDELSAKLAEYEAQSAPKAKKTRD